MIDYYPKHLEGKQRLEYLMDNKNLIIATKKQETRKSMPIAVSSESIVSNNFMPVSKAFSSEMPTEMPAYGEDIRVPVIGNMAGWLDWHDDVLLNKCYNRTVNNKGAKGMYFLCDHGGSVKQEIARLVDVRVESINPKDLSIETDVKLTDAIVFDALFSEKLDAKSYYQYYHMMAKQHSIGLRYVKLSFGINNEDYKEEYAVWQKYFSQIINKEKALKQGYAYFVEEIECFECSHVLWGANSATPQGQPESTSKTEPVKDDTSDCKNSDERKKFYQSLM